jgi:hypothetical protein
VARREEWLLGARLADGGRRLAEDGGRPVGRWVVGGTGGVCAGVGCEDEGLGWAGGGEEKVEVVWWRGLSGGRDGRGANELGNWQVL